MSSPCFWVYRQGREVIDFDEAPLGAGSFADVRLGTYAFSGGAHAQVAFKIFRGSLALDKTLYEQIVKEARLGHRLQHPNLIEFFGVLQIPRRGLALVLEFADGGSLWSVLSDLEAHPVISWALRVRWLREVGVILASTVHPICISMVCLTWRVSDIHVNRLR